MGPEIDVGVGGCRIMEYLSVLYFNIIIHMVVTVPHKMVGYRENDGLEVSLSIFEIHIL